MLKKKMFLQKKVDKEVEIKYNESNNLKRKFSPEIKIMEIIIYIVILTSILWIFGWLFEKYRDKMLSYFIYSIIITGIIGCVGSLILSYKQPIFWYLVVPLTLIYAYILVMLLVPKPAKDKKKHK